MRRFLHRQLTNDELKTREGMRYEGAIMRIEHQRVTNRWRYTRNENDKLVRQESDVPVIMFDDGWDWIPNLRARNVLTDTWGPDTDHWIGRRLAIYLRPAVRTEKASGRVEEKLEKFVEPLEHTSGER
jgi:hypothetical protein